MKLPKLSFRPRSNFLEELLIVIGVVLIWRGMWNIMDMYMFPDKPVLSNILGILFGFLLLYLPDEDLKELI